MIHIWATGKMEYVPDSKMFSVEWALANKTTILINIFWMNAIPIWRIVHFYFAHRFLHIRAVYTYVHSLHHRNYDPEPFSGITMHPVEHLYYYSCIFFPSLCFGNLSPFLFHWNFVHLMFSPCAGHSGWEDHWQADQFHYIHHQKFECNYGGSEVINLDGAFGHNRMTMRPAKEKIEADQPEETFWQSVPPAEDEIEYANAGAYLGAPKPHNLGYNSIASACFAVFSWGVFVNANDKTSAQISSYDVAGMLVPVEIVMAFVISAIPVLACFGIRAFRKDSNPWSWPFHEDSYPNLMFHVTMATLVCVVPVAAFAYVATVPM